ncbi:MAG TPA: SCP2 sterol-binding domain-containing protein [Symbiobacteriaceae bacterium]
MAASSEILEALGDYQVQCNGNARLRRMQKDWTKRLHFQARETGDWFTMVVVQGEITDFATGTEGTPDIVVFAKSEDLCDMFWGDLNPSQKYLRGEIIVKASPEDVMRLDAITMIIWPDAAS